MALREELERSGAWLFRYRSYAPPLLLIPLVLAGFEVHPDERAGLEPGPATLGAALAAVGLVIRILVIGFAPAGTSGKNRSLQVAESLTTTGLYSVVRHPLYLGNFFLWIGPAAATGSWWAPVLIALVFWLYHERIILAEEKFLRDRFGAEFLSWAAVTPAFRPALSRWRPPALPFSLRTVLRQEYYGFFSAVFLFSLLEALTVAVETGRPGLSRGWLVGLGAAAVVAGVLRILQRQTRWLDAPGR